MIEYLITDENRYPLFTTTNPREVFKHLFTDDIIYEHLPDYYMEVDEQEFLNDFINSIVQDDANTSYSFLANLHSFFDELFSGLNYNADEVIEEIVQVIVNYINTTNGYRETRTN